MMRNPWLTAVAALLVSTSTLHAQRLTQHAVSATAIAGDSLTPQVRPWRASMRVHRVLGSVALLSFGTALVTGAASGNLGKLMDPATCCPDGGARNQSVRRFDRALVTAGIVSYSGAAALAGFSLLRSQPPSNARTKHKAHRWLALAHGSAFVTSAVTGAMMKRAQDTNPAKFGRIARVHVASNVAFVPLLTAAFTNIIFER